MRDHVCAVDVGTGSARAGVFDRHGALLSRCEHPIRMKRAGGDQAEHASEDIWRAVASAVRAAIATSGLSSDRIGGIGFDATCSLVIRSSDGAPLALSESPDADVFDTIVWLDHRAAAEADACTHTRHAVVAHVGGVMSPEMQVPKLLWLKRHRPDLWARMGLAFDLADFLTWKATGSAARSQSTLASKWTYLPDHGGWQKDFLAGIGLEDLIERAALPDRATPVGATMGTLSPEAAGVLGLDTSCVVGAGLIDAFAGALGVIGGIADAEIDRHLALIAGTSSCVSGLSRTKRMVPGIWGPCLGVALPDHWLSEGGQSAAGALLDHVVRVHGREEPTAAAHQRIIARIVELRGLEGPLFAEGLHVLPDFHGNRSPLADPQARGVVSGLTLDTSFDATCRLYWRAAVAIALGIRHVIDHLNAHGHEIDTLHVTGGHTRNPLMMELYADATGCTVIETDAPDAVLLGSAMIAAHAAGLHESLRDASRAMRQPERIRSPDPERAAGYARDYRIFLRMHDHRREIDSLSAGAA